MLVNSTVDFNAFQSGALGLHFIFIFTMHLCVLKVSCRKIDFLNKIKTEQQLGCQHWFSEKRENMMLCYWYYLLQTLSGIQY